jgi:hypothetical protein
MLVDEEMWSELMDEAGRHLDRARDAFVNGHTRSAAMELHKASVMMQIDGSHAQDRIDVSLMKSAEQLDRFVERLRNGQSTDTVDDLDRLSSQALVLLAEHEHVKAVMSLNQRQMHRSGRYLRAAADNLERAIFRARIELSSSTSNAIRDAREIASKLADGTRSAVDEAGTGAETLGQHIKQFGKRIFHPAAKTP